MEDGTIGMAISASLCFFIVIPFMLVGTGIALFRLYEAIRDRLKKHPLKKESADI